MSLCAALGQVHVCQGSGLYGTMLCVPLALTHTRILIKAGGHVSMYVGLFCVGMCMPLRVPPCVQVWTKSACRRVYLPWPRVSADLCPQREVGPQAERQRGVGQLSVLEEMGPSNEGGGGGCGAGAGDSPPSPLRRRARGSLGALAERRRQQRRCQPGCRHQIDAGTDLATAAAVRLSPRGSDGGREGPRQPPPPRRPRPGGLQAACCRW